MVNFDSGWVGMDRYVPRTCYGKGVYYKVSTNLFVNGSIINVFPCIEGISMFNVSPCTEGVSMYNLSSCTEGVSMFNVSPCIEGVHMFNVSPV